MPTGIPFPVHAVVNQKGGVGKTTSAINLAFALANLGKRVLLIDLDAQGNATSGVGLERSTIAMSIFDVMVDERPIVSVVRKHKRASVDILPANADLTGMELSLVDLPQREFRLRNALKAVGPRYDVALIDCPPSLGLLTLNGLIAANYVLVPVQCEYYALEGLGQLVESIKAIRERLNEDLEIGGAMLTLYDGRTNLAREVVGEVRRFFGDKIFDTIIPRNIRLAEAPSFGQSIFDYDPSCLGARAYSVLGQEMIDRELV